MMFERVGDEGKRERERSRERERERVASEHGVSERQRESELA